jgi:hypothetical protein
VQEATRLDAIVMAHITEKARALNIESISLIDRAFSAGNIPERGLVAKRTVQAAASVLQARASQILAEVPNPFSAPHNLSWLFRTTRCPQDVRHFATRLGRGDVRVWSVAQASADEWRVLVQVDGAESKNEAVSNVAGCALRPSKSLRNRMLMDVRAVATPIGAMPAGFPALLPATANGSDGTFVELIITD